METVTATHRQAALFALVSYLCAFYAFTGGIIGMITGDAFAVFPFSMAPTTTWLIAIKLDNMHGQTVDEQRKLLDKVDKLIFCLVLLVTIVGFAVMGARYLVFGGVTVMIMGLFNIIAIVVRSWQEPDSVTKGSLQPHFANDEICCLAFVGIFICPAVISRVLCASVVQTQKESPTVNDTTSSSGANNTVTQV